MRYFLSAIIFMAILVGCATIKPVPVETVIRYETRDSLILRDSTVIIPIERIVDVVPAYDSLTMETTMAKARAWVDTATHTLKGELTNKQGTIYKYKDREKIVYRDSIVTKEVPVPTEVIKTKYPKVFWWLLGWCIFSVVFIATKTFFKMQISK